MRQRHASQSQFGALLFALFGPARKPGEVGKATCLPAWAPNWRTLADNASLVAFNATAAAAAANKRYRQLQQKVLCWSSRAGQLAALFRIQAPAFTCSSHCSSNLLLAHSGGSPALRQHSKSDSARDPGVVRLQRRTAAHPDAGCQDWPVSLLRQSPLVPCRLFSLIRFGVRPTETEVGCIPAKVSSSLPGQRGRSEYGITFNCFRLMLGRFIVTQ